MTAPTFAEPALGDHICLPMGSGEEKFEFLTEFGTNAVECGYRVLILTDPSEVSEATARLGSTLGRAQPGQMIVASCRETLVRDDRFDVDTAVAGFEQAKQRALEDGYEGLCVVGDLSWAVDADVPGLARLFDFEAESNGLFLDRRLTAVCLYDRGLFETDAADRLAAAHPITPEQAELRFSLPASGRGLRLVGEADATNRTALFHVLRPLLTVPGDVELDASEVSFADVEAIRLFGSTAEQRDEPTTIVASSSVARRLRLCGAESVVGLTIQAAPAAPSCPCVDPGPDLPFSTAFTQHRISSVRRTAIGYARRAGLIGAALEDFGFVANELVTNAVLHGGGAGRLRMWNLDRYLYVEVTDKGQGICNGHVEGYGLPERFSDRGRGLWFARRLAESVEIDTSPDGTTIWAAVAISEHGSEA